MDSTRAASRPRRARGSLTENEILDGAERVASAGSELTMRSVASSIGASAMALYGYFATKDQLLDALIDRVLSRVELPEATPDWLGDLRHLALSHSRTLHAHPWAISALFASPNPGIAATRIGECVLGILARGGVTGADAVAAFSGILALNYGRASFTAAGAAPEAMTAAIRSLPASYFPFTVQNAEGLGHYAEDANYERALGMLLAGIGDAATPPRTVGPTGLEPMTSTV